MTLLYAYFYALEEPSVFIDIVLTALCIGIIGAIGYVLFVSSMIKDYEERGGAPYNPWDELEGKTESKTPRRFNFSLKKIILILSLFAALAVVLFIISKRLG